MLLFPTAGGDAGEVARFHLITALEPLISAGRIKVYSVDNVPGQALLFEDHQPTVLAHFFHQYAAFVHDVVLPIITHDCDQIPVITAGASLGAFHAMALACRYPNKVRAAICMSPTFELARLLNGHRDENLYLASPLYFLGAAPETQVAQIRQQKLIMAFGSGPYENPRRAWQLSDVMRHRNIPCHLHHWGPTIGHDWSSWRMMLPHYLNQLTEVVPELQYA
ncbi:MAG: hypothetical protein KDC35_05375 [Acidobacteria bacterium]|nr:hypothetical protein [Acidobacteriota bacterium]